MTRATINTELMIEMHKFEIFKARTSISTTNMSEHKRGIIQAQIDEFELSLDLLIESHEELNNDT